jgi:hypothetical protein
MADATNRVHHAVVDMIAMRGCKRPGSSVGQPEAVLRPIVAPMVRHTKATNAVSPRCNHSGAGAATGRDIRVNSCAAVWRPPPRPVR